MSDQFHTITDADWQRELPRARAHTNEIRAEIRERLEKVAPANLTADQLRERFPNASEAFLRANGGLQAPSPSPAPQTPSNGKETAKKRIRQSTKPLLNKLETEWLAVLRSQYPTADIRAQAWRVKIAGSAWFKADFVAELDDGWHAWEVKGKRGKNIDRGKLALKVAASQWPQVTWWLCWKDADGEWVTQEVLP